MISIVICSVRKDLLDGLEKNIIQTIGVPYELIIQDNSTNQEGICKVYNEAGARAIYPVLCFMHEDILFETINWGSLVYRHLEPATTGMLGVAGGDTKSIAPSSWSQPAVSAEVNIIQHYKSGEKPDHVKRSKVVLNGEARRVLLLDGVWLCVKKEVFDHFKFDDLTFRGFHGYDIDYSLQVNTRYELKVAFDILIHHFSEGNPDKKWVNSAVLVSKKWRRHLPLSIYHLTKDQYALHHWHSLRMFVQQLLRLKYSAPSILYQALRYSFTRYFSIRRFLSLMKYILKQLSSR